MAALSRSRRGGWAPTWGAGGLLAVLVAAPALGQADPDRPEAGSAAGVPTAPVLRLEPPEALPAGEPGAAAIERPRATARAEGVVSPGLRVTLRGGESTGGGLRHRWIQTLGPPVELAGADEPEASFVVPAGASALGFLLIVGNPAGLDLAPVVVEVEGKGGVAGATLVADAGDDQVVAPGRQVTLNAIRSMPRGALGYRWIQVAGPSIGPKVEEGYVLTFAPAQPGLYRFALVVGSGSVVSEPDFVEVLVAAQAPGPVANPAATTAPLATADLARSALAEVPGGLAAAPELARAFVEVAERLDLYESSSALFAELSRRVEAVLPVEPSARAAWVQRFCTPVTARLADGLRRSGLEVARPGALEAPLSEVQKDVLDEELRAVAVGLRRLGTIR